ncbi:molybdenum ABC transporter ATP-binding protein [Aestuariicella hydrocarbonica]|uniref:Molybdenum ABC transporter ATP-binding protein n=1 Tax=Pseudomaricurvus hydrocarbonicus TaxID=1470433 RepID=A0A9E5JTP2_9GAMM|nr:molybdenum ABC transporter ATP-binding protein [Aestuariicella hydrocarbonica]
MSDNSSVLGRPSISARFAFAHDTGESTDFSLDVNLQLPASGVTAVYGHSGSGKTTLLRCIAGLQRNIHPQTKTGYTAHLAINNTIWQDEKTFLPTHKRALGYVFQESGLFAHLTIANNIDYGIRRAAKKPTDADYNHILALMGIQSLMKQFPAQLSGGERQRVAIARSLLIRPRLLLMDEPLSSLDITRKEDILPYLESLKSELNVPIIYVTHSMDEVARLADHLVVMEKGRVAAQGPLREVLSRLDLPVLSAEAGVVVEATVLERDDRWHLLRAEIEGGTLWLNDNAEAIGQVVRLRILAKDISLSKSANEATSILNRIPVRVTAVTPDLDDAMSLVQLAAGDTLMLARLTRRSVDQLALASGDTLWAQIKSVAIVR